MQGLQQDPLLGMWVGCQGFTFVCADGVLRGDRSFYPESVKILRKAFSSNFLRFQQKVSSRQKKIKYFRDLNSEIAPSDRSGTYSPSLGLSFTLTQEDEPDKTSAIRK